MAENKSSRAGTVVGIIALVLVCTVLGTLGGALAGGAAGYFVGRRTASGVGLPSLRGWRLQPSTPAPATPAPRDWYWPMPQQPQGNVEGVALIDSVVEGSPAAQAGLRAGDRIVAVNDTKLTVRRDLAQLVGRYKPGDTVELTIEREGKQEKVKVTLGKSTTDPNRAYLGVNYRMVWNMPMGGGISQ